MFVWFGTVAVAGVEVGLGGVGGGAWYEPDLAGAEGTGFAAAGSPFVSVRLDPFTSTIRPTFGLWSAPTFRYSVGYDAFTAPLAVAELGLQAGSERANAAITAHGGLLSFGGGLRGEVLPWTLGAKARTGVELRATWLARYGMLGGAAWVVRR